MWYASVIFSHFFQSSIKYRFEFRQIATFTYEILWQSSVTPHRGKSPEKFYYTRRGRRNRTNAITCPKSSWILGTKYLEISVSGGWLNFLKFYVKTVNTWQCHSTKYLCSDSSGTRNRIFGCLEYGYLKALKHGTSKTRVLGTCDPSLEASLV